MNTALPTERNIFVNITTDLWRSIIAVLLTVVVGNVLFLFHKPGASVGIFAIHLGALILCTRNTVPGNPWHMGAFAFLFLCSLQSVRYTSFSNVAVLAVLLLCLSGHSAHTGIAKPWLRWFEGMLSLARPLGTLFTFGGLEKKSPRKQNNSAKLGHFLAVSIPVVIVVILFGGLLGSGNLVMGKLNSTFFKNIADFLNQIELPRIERIVAWGVFAGVGLIFACPAKPTPFSHKLDNPWRQLGGSANNLRLHQWMASLVALNLLFLFSNVTDVIFLWFSRALPPGISHSEYVHHGVYALIATTLLSALLMALLTQHHPKVSHNRIIRGLAFAWMVQNLVLISGVYIRLWIYVDAYGNTPKRAYVALFLALVIIGYSFLGWAILKFKDIKWLMGANLILLFGYFSALQFVDTPKWVMQQNRYRYSKGEIEYPSNLFLNQIGSHGIPYLVSIYENPQSAEDQQNAIRDLEAQSKRMSLNTHVTWRSFQLRDSLNHQVLRDFKAAHSGN